jgi:hypothetical protein
MMGHPWCHHSRHPRHAALHFGDTILNSSTASDPLLPAAQQNAGRHIYSRSRRCEARRNVIDGTIPSSIEVAPERRKAEESDRWKLEAACWERAASNFFVSKQRMLNSARATASQHATASAGAYTNKHRSKSGSLRPHDRDCSCCDCEYLQTKQRMPQSLEDGRSASHIHPEFSMELGGETAAKDVSRTSGNVEGVEHS